MRRSLLILLLLISGGILGCTVFHGHSSGRSAFYRPQPTPPPMMAPAPIPYPQKMAPPGPRTYQYTPQNPVPGTPSPLRAPQTIPQSPQRMYGSPVQPPFPPREIEPTPVPVPTFAPPGGDNDSEPLELPVLRVPSASRPTPQTAAVPRRVAEMELKPVSGSTAVLSISAPSRRPIGSGTAFRVTVKNPRNAPLENITLRCEFDSALRFPGSERQAVQQDLGTLEANDVRETILTLWSDQVGSHELRVKLQQKGQSDVAEQRLAVEYVPRTLELELRGPESRYPGQRAEFNILVKNLGDETARDLRATLSSDSVLTLREVTAGGQNQGEDRLQWPIGDLRPGEAIQLQAEYAVDVPTSQAGLKIELEGHELPSDWRQSWLTVAAPSGPLHLEMRDGQDPSRIGQPFTVTTIITNNGLEDLSGVTATLVPPEGTKLVAVEQSGAVTATLSKPDQIVPTLLSARETLRPAARWVLVWTLVATSTGQKEVTCEVTAANAPLPERSTEVIGVLE